MEDMGQRPAQNTQEQVLLRYSEFVAVILSEPSKAKVLDLALLTFTSFFEGAPHFSIAGRCNNLTLKTTILPPSIKTSQLTHEPGMIDSCIRFVFPDMNGHCRSPAPLLSSHVANFQLQRRTVETSLLSITENRMFPVWVC